MHAVVVSVTVSKPEEATTYLRNEVVPRVSKAPGFVSGYWVRLEGSDKGRATIVFESEQEGRDAAGQITPHPVLDSVEIGGVVAYA